MRGVMLTHRMLHRIAPALFTSRPGLPLDIPGPPPGRYLSTGGALLPWAEDSLGHATKLFRDYGRVVALVRGGGMRHIACSVDCPGTVLCHGADLNQKITSAHEVYSKSYLSGALHPGPDPEPRKRPLLSFGAGLFSVNGDEHRLHRRLLTPLFSRRRLSQYCEQMVAVTQETLQTWRLGQVRETSSDMRLLTARVVTRTLFGNDASLAVDAASRALKESLDLMGKPLTRLLTFDLPGLPYRRYLDAAADLERHVQALLDAKKRSPVESDDMLSAFLHAQDEESGAKLSDQEILGHVSVFFAAGHETTAHALGWTLLLLACFPRVAEKVQAELERVLGQSAPSFEQLEQLEYLGSVIKESLRLFTPAPWNGRVLTEQVELDGYTIPAGSEVFLSLYETHRRDPIYERPYAFEPERWEHIRPSAYQYAPFSAGPRTCIGAMFAQIELKVVLALVLQRFRLELVSSRIDRFAEMVLCTKQPLLMRVQAADGRFQRSVRPFSGDVHEMVEFPRHTDARPAPNRRSDAEALGD
jgi:cytochrome P450